MVHAGRQVAALESSSSLALESELTAAHAQVAAERRAAAVKQADAEQQLAGLQKQVQLGLGVQGLACPVALNTLASQESTHPAWKPSRAYMCSSMHVLTQSSLVRSVR